MIIRSLTCVCFLDVTISSNSDIEQLRIKSSDGSIPSPLGHDYLLSAETSDDIKQWYRALQESNLLDKSVMNCRKQTQPAPVTREVCVFLIRMIFSFVFSL